MIYNSLEDNGKLNLHLFLGKFKYQLKETS